MFTIQPRAPRAPRRSAAALISLFTAGFVLATVWAQTPVALPALHGEGLTADTTTGELVLFGGQAGSAPFEGTWRHGPSGWVRTDATVEAPPHRGSHAMGFDPERREVFLFGGMRSRPFTLFCDTWILGRNGWRSAAESPCLDDRQRNASLVYDRAAKAMLLVSGPAIADNAPRPLEIWRWTGRDWTLVDRSGPRRVGFGAVAYDESRAALVVPVLFGGPDAGTWEWRAGSWTHVTTDGPATRQTFALAYDSARRRVVLAGGQGASFFDDVWTWDGARWRRETLEGNAGPRAGATLVDRRDGRLTYFGGYDDAGLRPEMWELRGSTWRRVDP
jgi:hypothetical protein